MRNESRRSGLPKWEYLVIVSITGMITLFFFKNTWNPKGPSGKMIPVTSPREENRIFHPLGLSFIAPPNWDSNLIMRYHQDVPRLSVAPRNRLKIRYQRANFNCMQINQPEQEELSKSQQVQFQGFPAFERMYVWRKDSFDAPPCSIYCLLVNRKGQWWRITYEIGKETTTLPSIMREYFDTIRFPPLSKEVV